MAERKFEQDKVYLQGPDGQIWPYDPHLTKIDGFKSVIPNKSKAAPKQQTQTDDGNKGSNTNPNTQNDKSDPNKQ